MEWDDSVESVNVIEEDHPNLSIVHTKNSKIAMFSPRQFIDKRVTFKSSSGKRNLDEVRFYIAYFYRKKNEYTFTVVKYQKLKKTK